MRLPEEAGVPVIETVLMEKEFDGLTTGAVRDELGGGDEELFEVKNGFPISLLVNVAGFAAVAALIGDLGCKTSASLT